MGKFIIGLLEKLSKINIKELQSDNARLQGENVRLNTLVRETNQQLYSAERKIECLQAQCDEFDPEKLRAEIECNSKKLFQEKEYELIAMAQELENREQLLKQKEIELQDKCHQYELALQQASPLSHDHSQENNEVTDKDSITPVSDDLHPAISSSTDNPSNEALTSATDSSDNVDKEPDATVYIPTSEDRPDTITDDGQSILASASADGQSEGPVAGQVSKNDDPSECTPVQDSSSITAPLPVGSDEPIMEKVEDTGHDVPSDEHGPAALPTANQDSTHEVSIDQEKVIAKPISNKPSANDTEEKPYIPLTIDSFNELKSSYPYIRVSTTSYTQLIFNSSEVDIAVGLFETGINGHELITDKNIYLVDTDILDLEGLQTPFAGEEIECDFSNEEISEHAAQILLTAICTGQPLYATYDDKNGRITERNMYFISFKPKEKRFVLPYKNLFANLFNEELELDTDNIAAMTQKHTEPKIFSVSQILTLRPYNAFVSTPQGIKYIKEGIRIAKKSDQKDFAKLIKSEILKRIPQMPQKLLGR